MRGVIGEKESHYSLDVFVEKVASRVICRTLDKGDPIGDGPIIGTKE